MPFTLAHPAAVIPLCGILRRASVPSALIIGSMAPDLVYFVPLGSTGLQAIVWRDCSGSVSRLGSSDTSCFTFWSDLLCPISFRRPCGTACRGFLARHGSRPPPCGQCWSR